LALILIKVVACNTRIATILISITSLTRGLTRNALIELLVQIYWTTLESTLLYARRKQVVCLTGGARGSRSL
jgi:hypothetical protein